MTEISFAAAELVFAAVWVLVRAAVCLKKGGADVRRELILLLLYVDLAVILRFTFFPMRLDEGHIRPLVFDPETVFQPRVNLIPFVNMFDYSWRSEMLINVLGNIALFIPSGAVLPVCFRRLSSFPRTVLAGALISLSIEILQLPFCQRYSDIDDLLLNTAGCAAGYLIFAGVRKIVRRSKSRKKETGSEQTDKI